MKICIDAKILICCKNPVEILPKLCVSPLSLIKIYICVWWNNDFQKLCMLLSGCVFPCHSILLSYIRDTCLFIFTLEGEKGNISLSLLTGKWGFLYCAFISNSISPSWLAVTVLQNFNKVIQPFSETCTQLIYWKICIHGTMSDSL